MDVQKFENLFRKIISFKNSGMESELKAFLNQQTLTDLNHLQALLFFVMLIFMLLCFHVVRFPFTFFYIVDVRVSSFVCSFSNTSTAMPPIFSETIDLQTALSSISAPLAVFISKVSGLI